MNLDALIIKQILLEADKEQPEQEEKKEREVKEPEHSVF
jgi:hypothetical protein